MDAQNLEENLPNKENDSSNNNNDNKKTDSEQTDTSTKASLENNQNLNKEEKEKIEKKDNSNLSEKAQKNISEINEKNKNSEENISNTINKNETKNKENENDKFLKEVEVIKELRKSNYKPFYIKQKFCDFRERENRPWKIGLIKDVLEDKVIVEDVEKDKKIPIQIKDSSKLSYIRKYSELNDENYYQKRDSKEMILKKFLSLEQILKDDNLFKNEENAWDIYYILHSKIFFGVDYAMKINNGIGGYYYKLENDNEGCEESFRFLLLILNFISKYYKYLVDNKDEFINYQNNIINTEFVDLKIINKKYAFFSFFESSIDLLNKIFANTRNYLDWFRVFENELKTFVPSINDQKIKPNPQFYPLYEEEKEEKKEKEKEKEGKEGRR